MSVECIGVDIVRLTITLPLRNVVLSAWGFVVRIEIHHIPPRRVSKVVGWWAGRKRDTVCVEGLPVIQRNRT